MALISGGFTKNSNRGEGTRRDRRSFFARIAMTGSEPIGTPEIPPHIRAAAESLMGEEAADMVRAYVGHNPRLQAVEDITQAVRIAFWKSLPAFEQRTADLTADLRGLLSTIAKHQVQNASKSARRTAENLEAAVLERSKERGKSPQRLVSHDQAVAYMYECLAKLDTNQRLIVDHLYGRGATVVETAAVLGVPEYSVRRERDRILDQLQTAMGSSGKWTLSPAGDSH